MKFNSIALMTGNSGKLNEFKHLLNVDSIIFENRSFNIHEIQSMRLEDIGKYKTISALNLIDESDQFDIIMTDDTSLSCDALKGLPGPFIKWFLDTVGVDGLYNLVKSSDLECSAACLITIGIIETGELIQFKGDVRGKIVAPRGTSGFGWDQIFLPQGHEVTYGEMKPDQKNKVSHRAKAVEKFRTWLIAH